MNLENPSMPPEYDESHLSLEEAQEEANMMRVRLKEVFGHEPTTADYDNALQAVEEMKEAAANESEGERKFLKAMEVGNKYFQGGATILWQAITLGFGKMEPNEFHDHMFDSAHTRLERLKEEAEKHAGSK